MSPFAYKLEHRDGKPADPPTLKTAVPNWRTGDTIPLGDGRILRVVDMRASATGDADPVLVVEPVPTPTQSFRKS
jgi:hypothetical protein